MDFIVKNENNDRIVRDTMSSESVLIRADRVLACYLPLFSERGRAISKTSIHCLKMYGASIHARCAFVSRRHFRRNIETRFANSCENGSVKNGKNWILRSFFPTFLPACRNTAKKKKEKKMYSHFIFNIVSSRRNK